MNPEQWQEINELFHSALKREPGQRAAFLKQACAGNESVRKEVEAFIAAHDQAGNFIEAPAYAVAGEMLRDKNNQSLTGRSFGRYKVLAPIGEGGMGEVYLAQDTRLERKVALKLLPSYYTMDQDRVRRFQQEARAASALNHPNIITIHEIGQVEERYFIATEFIDGETLRIPLSGPGLGLRVTLDVAIQIASALVAAHKAGIVHRDIKPENIMLRRDDGIVKVLDFGLVKLTEQNPQQNSDTAVPTKLLVKTDPGIVMGTVRYMSPEQARGLEVDARTDIWSLGVLIYEMIVGRQPFAGETASDVIASVLKTEPPPLMRVAPEMPAELDRILTKTLAKDREERYQTAKDLLIDLKRLRQRLDVDAEIERASIKEPRIASWDDSGQPAIQTSYPVPALTAGPKIAQPTSSAEYVVSTVKQHKVAAIVALAVLVFGVAIAYFWRPGGHLPAITSVAVLPFTNANGDPEIDYLSEGISESLINSLSQLPQLKVIARSSSFRYKGKDGEPQEVAKALGVEGILTGRIVQRGDTLVISAELVDARDRRQIWGEQYDRKVTDLVSLQGEIARQIVDKLKLKVSGDDGRRLDKNYTENNEAYQSYLKGRFYWNKRTKESIEKSIAYFNQAIEKDPGFALAYGGLADCYLVPANPRPPREKMPKAKAAAMRALELDDSLGEAHASLARVLMVYDWDWSGAEKEFKRALELNPRYAIAHQWYGGYLQTMDRSNEAIAERKLAQELDPLSLIINWEVGLALYYSHDYDQAIEQFQKTLDMDPNFAPVRGVLAAAYEQKGMYDTAIAEYKKGILQGSGASQLPLAGLGHVLAISGKKDEARVVLDQLKAQATKEYVPANNMALIYAGLGDKDQAFVWLEKAYDERAFALALGLKKDPRWDNLRSDPRYVELLRRMGLHQ